MLSLPDIETLPCPRRFSRHTQVQGTSPEPGTLALLLTTGSNAGIESPGGDDQYSTPGCLSRRYHQYPKRQTEEFLVRQG
jgi:hypothetical protein